MLALLAAPSLAASDDFGLLNRLLEAVTVPIPPIATEVGPATVEAWDIECSRLRVADVELRALPQPGAIRVSGAVRGLEVACTGQWSLEWGIVREEGDINLSAAGAVLEFDITAETARVTRAPPYAELEPLLPPRLDRCDASLPLNIDSIDGGAVAGLVSWERVESALLGFVKEDIDSEICNQMGGPLIDALANASAAAYDLLEPHVQRSLDQNITRGSRVVEAEADMAAAAAAQNKTLVVMTTDSSSPPPAVEEGLGFLGFRQTAPQPTAHERRFSLRPFLKVLRTIVGLAAGAIVAAGEFSVNVTALGANASIFDLGAVGDARVLLGFEQLTISGLETLRVVEEMAVVGPYTLRHAFELDSLSIELDLSVGIEDAVAVGEPPPFDAFSVSLGLADLEIELDTLVALSEDALTTLQIGSIARSPAGCLLDAVFGVAIPSLALRVGDIAFPRVQGLINARVTQVASTVFDTVHPASHSPGIFPRHTTPRHSPTAQPHGTAPRHSPTAQPHGTAPHSTQPHAQSPTQHAAARAQPHTARSSARTAQPHPQTSPHPQRNTPARAHVCDVSAGRGSLGAGPPRGDAQCRRGAGPRPCQRGHLSAA